MIDRLSRWTLMCLLGLTLAALPAATVRAEDTGGAPADTPAQPADDAGQDTQTTTPPADTDAVDTDAQPTTAPATQPAEGEDGPPPPKKPNYIFLLLIGMVVLWIWMGRKPRAAEKKRKEMLSNLKKGDKITSIGGIVGTVLEVRDDEVTVKVDEASNTRMKFARWAVRGVGVQTGDEQPEEK